MWQEIVVCLHDPNSLSSSTSSIHALPVGWKYTTIIDVGTVAPEVLKISDVDATGLSAKVCTGCEGGGRPDTGTTLRRGEAMSQGNWVVAEWQAAPLECWTD
nr:hypothetical protein Iba_chr08eCG7030 [Ipomoea batatas]